MSEIDISAIAQHLECDDAGIWISRVEDAISYPDEGNQNCLNLEISSFWFEHRSRCIAAVMERWRPAGTVFDIGGGNGYVSIGLQDKGIPVALVEPGRHGVLAARERGVHVLINATLESAGFYPGTLPAVGLFDVLEHIEDDAGFLSTICELLQPGGIVYLTVPAYPVLWSVDDAYAGHYRRYTIRRLQSLLRGAGFDVQFASGMFFFLPLPIFLLRSIPSRLGLRKQKEWDRYHTEHRRQTGAVGWLLDRVMNGELSLIRSGNTIPFGGSLLVAARKRI